MKPKNTKGIKRENAQLIYILLDKDFMVTKNKKEAVYIMERIQDKTGVTIKETISRKIK